MNIAIDAARPRSVALGAAMLGVIGGLAAALLLTFVGEPRIEQAINIEMARAGAGASAAGEPEIVSRSVQKGVGLFAAYAVSGAAFGLLFAVVFWTLRRSRPDPFRRALVAGAVLAGALTLAPWLKYPPNPPAVGDPGTLAQRQLLYVSVIVLAASWGLAAAALSAGLRRSGWSEARRVVTVVAVIVVPMGLAFAVLPGAPDPITVPANLLWSFRLASLSGNLLLWTVIALGFGLLAVERVAASTNVPNDDPTDGPTDAPTDAPDDEVSTRSL